MTHRVTVADVAKEAGVSRATVSYALNDRPGARMSDATRQLVLDSARRLGYQGSPAARALRVGRGEVVVLLLPDWDTTGELGRALREIGRRTAELGLVCLRYEGPDWKNCLGELLGMVTAAAVVTFEPLEASDASALSRSGVPEVQTWFVDAPDHRHTTRINQADIVRAQVDHLLERGYRSLAYIVAEEDRDQRFAQSRLDAFHAICALKGMRSDRVEFLGEDLIWLAGSLRAWVQDSGRVGIVAFSDLTAVGVLSAVTTTDLTIPGDVGVIGVDNSRMTTLVVPALTSVQLNLVGEAAVVAAKLASELRISTRLAPNATAPITVVARRTT